MSTMYACNRHGLHESPTVWLQAPLQVEDALHSSGSLASADSSRPRRRVLSRRWSPIRAAPILLPGWPSEAVGMLLRRSQHGGLDAYRSLGLNASSELAILSTKDTELHKDFLRATSCPLWFECFCSRAYIVSPLFLRNAGTSRSACSKFAIIALRMLSREITSADATGAEEAWWDSITIGAGAGSESKSSAPALTVNPVDSVFRRGRSSSLNPVAMTVIFTASFIFSSSTAPKIMLASSCAAL